MKPHPKTLVLVALASGMVASAYLIGPAPAATSIPASQAQTRLPPAAPVKSASTLKTLRAPVPLLVGTHDSHFDESTVPDTRTALAPPQAGADVQQASAAGDSAAKASIEMDGYRNVRALVRSPDGIWHGRAMRGRTEIAVSVDPSGNVSQD
jgi:hypothetical protein